MAKLIIADDHPIVLKGLELMLRHQGHEVIFTTGNGIEAYHQILSLTPDIALLDIDMPGMTGLEIARKTEREAIGVPIVLLTMHRDARMMEEARALKVDGYLLKDFALEEIEACVNAVLRQQSYYSAQLQDRMTESSKDSYESLLSASEIKILRLIAQNKTSAAIASILFIAEKTVEKHRSNIIRKLNLPREKNSLLVWALQHNYGQ